MAARALKKRHGKGDGLTSGRVQALLFPRDSWAMEDAIVWASLHGFGAEHYDVTDNYVRVHPHGKQKKARRVKTIPWGANGIRAVIEWR